MKLRYLLFLILFLFTQVMAASKMPSFLAKSELSEVCKQQLIAAAAHIIGPKEHRILENKNPHSANFEIFMLLTYKDQESHVNFSAVPNKDGCEVSYSESFEINMPCVEAREALFKRWQVLGKMSATTIVMRYDFPRDEKQLPQNEDDRATAYLTQTRHGSSCLITRKQQRVNYPMPSDEDLKD